jgi:transposase
MIIWDDLVMAKRYRPVERDQVFLLPPSMREWLSAGHPVWLVIRAVERMDTAAFRDLRRLGGAGAAGYDPDMLVTVLVWAYAHQVTSSRRIGQLCHTDVAFRVICGGNLPGHTTIARFRESFPGTVASLFAGVLGLCAQLGMGRLGVVALDGTKIAASASASANRAEEHLRKLAAETVAAHGRAGAEEDDLFGPGRRGGEVPPDAWSPRSRDERITAALDSLRAEREAAGADNDARAGAYLASVAAGQRGAGHGNRPLAADVAASQLRLDRVRSERQAIIDAWHQRNEQKIAATGRGVGGHAPVPVDDNLWVRRAEAALARAQARTADARRRAAERQRSRRGPGPVRNTTDPDSRMMPVRGGGFIQGYNAQLVTSEDGLIIAAKLTSTPVDVSWLTPMMTAAQAAADLITARRPAPAAGDDDDAAWRTAGYTPPAEDGQAGYAGPIGLLLADAGYCSEANITAPGPPRLIATGKHRALEQAARSPATAKGSQRGQHTIAMAALLQTEDGITAYRHRGHIAETPNGDIKHNKRFRQLSVRGLAKASGEMTFTAAVTNLFKAISSGHLTHAAPDNLASYHPAT